MNDSKSDFPSDAMTGPNAPLTSEDRYNCIAEAAYLRAAARGFAGGDPLQDWLDAEADLMNSVDDDRSVRAR